MRHLVVALAMTVLAVPTVTAGELAGVRMADSVTVDDTTLQLNGMGVRKKLWIKVYVGGLYLPSRATSAAAASSMDGPKKMVMHFLTDKATKEKMDDAWREGFENNAPQLSARLGDEIDRFVGFFGDMKDGDLIEMELVPGAGTTVSFNGTVRGTVEGDDFAQALLSVWLGEEPPSEDFQEGLLGG